MGSCTEPGHPYLESKNHASKGINKQMNMGGGTYGHLTSGHMHPKLKGGTRKMSLGKKI